MKVVIAVVVMFCFFSAEATVSSWQFNALIKKVKKLEERIAVLEKNDKAGSVSRVNNGGAEEKIKTPQPAAPAKKVSKYGAKIKEMQDKKRAIDKVIGFRQFGRRPYKQYSKKDLSQRLNNINYRYYTRNKKIRKKMKDEINHKDYDQYTNEIRRLERLQILEDRKI
ncbi:MAG: hypothetical protein L3J71_04750 [Victivallaceae bacterium]|nr:hypothetical protein [Victivallaceae bacterium]